jgi:hypothetical protein
MTTDEKLHGHNVVATPARDAVLVENAGTRFLLMTGQPYGEVPVFNGPFVD